jgi:hypothetical protein
MAEALLFQWDALPRNFAAERRCLRGASEQRFAIAGNNGQRCWALLFLGTFTFGFLEFRFNTYDYFPFNLFLRYRYHLTPTNTAALTAFVVASIAFYVESSRRR